MNEVDRSTNEGHIWSEHGYVFSAAFGVLVVSFGSLFGWLLNIPSDLPLKEILGPVEIVFFLLLMGANSAVSYLCALAISRLSKLVCERLIRHMRGHKH